MYEMKTAADTLRMLETDKDKGLTRREAMERRAKYGANRLESQEQKSLGQMIAEQLNDPLILILVVAMAISLMLHELGDAVIIVTVVVLNAAVGIIQEGKAGKAVEALKKISSPQAVVLREGERAKIAAEELVQGDIVLLEAGNMVPADLRLIETNGVCVEESTLTGESVPVEKEAEHVVETSGDNSCMNMAYMSTYVTKGRGMGVVTATGMDTRIGHIAGMLHEGKAAGQAGRAGEAVECAGGRYLYLPVCGGGAAEAGCGGDAFDFGLACGGGRAGGAARDRDDRAGAERIPYGAGENDRAQALFCGDTGGCGSGLFR